MMATGSPAAATASGSSSSSRSLQDTPTWALATVCFIFISLSVFIEHLIHLICNWLKKHRKTALFEAVEKLKSVLMLLGFMSLTLTVTQRPISKLCIPTKVAYTMLPCRKSGSTKTTKALGLLFSSSSMETDSLFEDFQFEPGRRLAGSSVSSDHCESQGKTSFISEDGINQLNIFIFVLAIMQIVYSVLTMALGRAKVKLLQNKVHEILRSRSNYIKCLSELHIYVGRVCYASPYMVRCRAGHMACEQKDRRCRRENLLKGDTFMIQLAAGLSCRMDGGDGQTNGLRTKW